MRLELKLNHKLLEKFRYKIYQILSQRDILSQESPQAVLKTNSTLSEADITMLDNVVQDRIICQTFLVKKTNHHKKVQPHLTHLE
jgi:hypothetical protein